MKDIKVSIVTVCYNSEKTIERAIKRVLEQTYSNVCQVGTDDFGGGRQIGEYLLSQGHRKLLLVADNDRGEDHCRWLGFREAMEAAGLDCEPQTAKKLVSAFITNYLNNQQQRNSP